MSLLASQEQLLKILVANLEKPCPQLVHSNYIADKMKISVTETQQVLNSMQGLGVVESDEDKQFSLITLKGISWLNRLTYH